MKIFNFKDGSIEDLLKSDESINLLLDAIGSEKIQSQRWFRRKNLRITRLKLSEYFYIRPGERSKLPFAIIFIIARYADKSSETYFFPIAFLEYNESIEGTLIKVRTNGGIYSAVDALSYGPFLDFMNRCLQSKVILKGRTGNLVFESEIKSAEPRFQPIVTNSTNSMVRILNGSIMKFIRKVEKGINVEYEMTNYLTRKGFKHSPALEGGIGFFDKEGSTSRIAIGFREIDNFGDGWSWAMKEIQSFFDYAKGGKWDEKKASRYLEPYLDKIEQLSCTVCDLHSVLASESGHPRFKPERITVQDLDTWQESFMRLVKRSIDDAQKYVLDHPDSSAEVGKVNLSLDRINRAFERLKKTAKDPGYKIRIHCDLHLGQVLVAPDGFKIIDFEGEPLRSPEERAAKYSPLKDVAVMLRSFHYAAYASYFNRSEQSRNGEFKRYADFWHEKAANRFTKGYLAAAKKNKLAVVPYSEPGTLNSILALFKLEKAVYELCYELNNRPMWITIPLAGIKSCFEELDVD